MMKHNADNERIKRKYFVFLKEAKQLSEQSVDGVAAALSRFEQYTQHRDFKKFHHEQAIAFKKHLTNQKVQQSGKNLSKATIHATLNQLKQFFQWLAREPGYKSRIQYSDAEYFHPSLNDTHIATARREQPWPTMEQIKLTLAAMPNHTDIERRNRALFAFTILVCARVNAIASMKLKHINIEQENVYQDARDVKTKFGKTFTTTFFPVGDEIRQIVTEWVEYLKTEQLWGMDDPLFPATQIGLSAQQQFEVVGLKREHWSTTNAIREIFKEAFERVGLRYFNPHSFRHTLSHLGEQMCQTPEQFKAWSQNIGHEKVMTTFTSYGEVSSHRQAEIIKELANSKVSKQGAGLADEIIEKMLQRGITMQGQPVT